MSRPRGDISATAVDLGWPHQVALPVEQCTGKAFEAPNVFCRELSAYWRKSEVSDGNARFLVFCFREPQDAAMFKEAFEGIPLYPEDRKGRTWKRPPGDVRRQPKTRNPYDWR
jgi:hypothetical protein